MGTKRKRMGFTKPSAKKKKLSSVIFKQVYFFSLDGISRRFPHLFEAIVNELDDKSLVKCREIDETLKNA